ncbi:hypothetical protein SS53G_3003 [Shigella sonnei 53G]|nr:hypothetical protein SS53G_3003 [Shigella sonnei 53G]
MGGAAFFVLKGCGDSSDVDNDGDGTFYATVQDCIDDGNNADICARGWNNAKTAFYADVPKNMTQQNCQSKYENCYYDNVEQSWIPVVSGFLLSRVIRKDRDEPFVYNSGGSSFASRPVWRNTSGDYSWRSGSGKKESYSSGGFTTKKRQPFRAAAMVVLPAPVGIGEANHAETQRSCAAGSGPNCR